jgi:hypothetical protein
MEMNRYLPFMDKIFSLSGQDHFCLDGILICGLCFLLLHTKMKNSYTAMPYFNSVMFRETIATDTPHVCQILLACP